MRRQMGKEKARRAYHEKERIKELRLLAYRGAKVGRKNKKKKYISYYFVCLFQNTHYWV